MCPTVIINGRTIEKLWDLVDVVDLNQDDFFVDYKKFWNEATVGQLRESCLCPLRVEDALNKRGIDYEENTFTEAYVVKALPPYYPQDVL